MVKNQVLWSVALCLRLQDPAILRTVRLVNAVNYVPVNMEYHHKVRHPRCVYNKLYCSLYTCLTQLYGGIDMYNLLHTEQLQKKNI